MEILKLLDKNVMEKTDRNEFFSTIFTRKKRDGTFRLILNLRHLNISSFQNRNDKNCIVIGKTGLFDSFRRFERC